ncbi:NAD(P)/FAD-dependent oxidoreductase [Rhodospirillum sp. A1_3_36]|uniref:NAD(P)/FAD-dependent oxidoreductase n=1 Tax=Rhodospirillum sp. A1_3_36 TaxID=3391666 RepID=UPI0039A651E8
MNTTVAVIGAGMVGLSCALELQARGKQVILIDRSPPGRETSYGNAGVFTRSSLLPLNNTGLWRNLPKLMTNTQGSLRWHLGYMARNLSWALRFLSNATPAKVRKTCEALDSLITLSLPVHDAWIREAGYENHLRKTGWIHLFRSSESHGKGEGNRNILSDFGLRLTDLAPGDIRALEPSLRPIYKKGVLIEDSWSVDNPGGLVEAYGALFSERGGQFIRMEARTIEETDQGVTIHGTDSPLVSVDQVVIALGPWARSFLESLGYRVPMGYERGYHLHFPLTECAPLTRPVYDVDGGCVLAPMAQGIRVSTGVELANLDAPATNAQMIMAETTARQALPLGERIETTPWKGARPSFPDSRPVIDRAPGRKRVWLTIGHQHIGLSTGPGTAKLLGALMDGATPPIDPTPFQAKRFIS